MFMRISLDYPRGGHETSWLIDNPLSSRTRRSINRSSNWTNYNDSIQNREDSIEECSSVYLLSFFHHYYLPFMILIGLVGNLLSCIVFLNTHLKMRSSSYYLAALAMADFAYLISLLLVWLNSTFGLLVFNKEGWCESLVYVSAVCSSLSVWLIVAFTVERFIAVQYPLHRPHMCTIARAKSIVCGLVVLALVGHSYSFVIAGVTKTDDGYDLCGLKYEYLQIMSIISIVDIIFSLIAPLVLIVVMNTMIMRNLLKFSRRFKETPSFTMGCPTRERSDINLNAIPIRDCAESFAKFVMEDSKGSGKIYDTKNIFGRYTTDVIATCAFGLSVDSMRNPDNEFFVLGGEATNLNGPLGTKMFLGKNFPWLMRLFGIRLMSDRVVDFFTNIVSTTIEMRDETGTKRPDMIQLMMDSRGRKDGTPDMTIEEMTSQAFVFFFGGFDTSSYLMCFVAHQLAAHPLVKEKLRNEIDNVMRGTKGEPTYETITKNMKYLDAVVNETLRIYTIAPFLDRVCVERFELPPPVDGGDPVVVEPGTSFYFSVYGFHRDSQYFDNPNQFDPDRFFNGDAESSPVYMPFGIGPRICIANRFALMETKVLLFYLLFHCDLQLCDKMKADFVFSRKNFAVSPENGFWLKIRNRKKE